MAEEKHGGLRGAMDRVQDAVGGMVGMASAATAGSASASGFVENAAIGDLYEIEAARLALSRTRSPQIRALAQEIIQDHMTSSHHLTSALRMNEAQGTIPGELDTRRSTMIDHLREAAEDEFDRTWLSQQEMAHQETLTLFEGFASNGDNAQLQSFARATIPALRQHKAMIEAASA
jgi:putative membrane protein